MVWLVIAGPAAVVVAAVATAVLAFRNADTLVTDPSVSARPPGHAQAHMPAMQARNHAAAASQPAR